MPYGDDITEGLVYTLSNPAGSTNYSATGEAYDVAIGGLPFFLLKSTVKLSVQSTHALLAVLNTAQQPLVCST